jgi:hypothetical protein
VQRTVDAHPHEIAALARLLSSCHDPLIASIGTGAVDELCRSIDALAPTPGETVVLAGGLLAADRPVGSTLADRLRTARLHVSHATEPVHGALRLARERLS